jgi:PKD repeat protein
VCGFILNNATGNVNPSWWPNSFTAPFQANLSGTTGYINITGTGTFTKLGPFSGHWYNDDGCDYSYYFQTTSFSKSANFAGDASGGAYLNLESLFKIGSVWQVNTGYQDYTSTVPLTYVSGSWLSGQVFIGNDAAHYTGGSNGNTGSYVNTTGAPTSDYETFASVGTLPQFVSFTETPSYGYAPLTVQFNDTSMPYLGANQWLWNFGDGYTSTLQNPAHAYAYIGNYTVSLAVTGTNGQGSATNTVNVLNPSKYYLGVNVVDASTSNPVFTSYLASAAVSDGYYYNNTNNYAFFNVTGTGSVGANPLYLGELLDLQAGAPGYAMTDKPWTVDQTTGANGFPISIAIAPLSIVNISGQTTVIANVQSNTTHAELANALVSIQPSNPNNASQTKYTSSSGIATFTNFSAADSLTITASLNGYSSQTKTINAQVGGVVNEQLSLVPSSGGYTLTLSPSSGPGSQVFTASVTGPGGVNINNIPNLIYYYFYTTVQTQNNGIYNTQGHQIFYNRTTTSSNWAYQNANGTYISVGSTLPASDSFTVPGDVINASSNGNITFVADLGFSDYSRVYPQATIQITGITNPAGPYLPVTVIDSSSGNVIGNSALAVQLQSTNYGLNQLTNQPFWNLTSTNGQYNVTGVGTGGTAPLIYGYGVGLFGSATGYQSNSALVTVSPSTSGVNYILLLTPSNEVPISGQFTAVITLYGSQSNLPITNGVISLNGVAKSTGSSGSATFTNITAGQYYATCSATGYTSTTALVAGGSGQIEQISVALVPGSVITTAPTFTVTTIPIIQTNVPITPVGGNYTGFWGNAEQTLATLGATPTELGILMACLLVICGVVIGGAAAGMIGAEVGGCVAFVMACAFGFISFYWIAAIVLILIFVAVKPTG